jgi:hypothetical protein
VRGSSRDVKLLQLMFKPGHCCTLLRLFAGAHVSGCCRMQMGPSSMGAGPPPPQFNTMTGGFSPFNLMTGMQHKTASSACSVLYTSAFQPASP